VQSFAPNGAYLPLCNDRSLSAWFTELLRPHGDYGAPCLAGVRDTDPTTPGLQPDCVVEDHQYMDVDGGVGYTKVDTVVPACDKSAPPCWRLESNKAKCPRGEVELVFDRGPDWCPADDLNSSITCLSCLHADDPACNGG